MAGAALLTVSAFADTTISTSTSTPLFTSHLSDTSDEDSSYTYGAGNITITSAGVIKPGDDSVSAITINGAQSVYSNGLIQNNSQGSVYGIEVDMSDFDKDSTAWGASGATFTNASGSTVSNALIYLDSSSVLKLAGDSGSTKYGIWINGSSSSCLDSSNKSSCVVTGDIVAADGSDIYMKGSAVRGIYMENYTELNGDLSLNGTIEVYQLTASSTSSVGLHGVYMLGKIDGDVTLSSTGKILVAGQGGYGMYISGGGFTSATSSSQYAIGGSLTINGTILVEGTDTSLISSYDPDNDDTTYPEGTSALAIGGSIVGGFKNTGTIETIGTGESILISPSLAYGASAYDTVESLVLGTYGNTGYGIYNTGTISIAPTNTNKSATAAIEIIGGGSKYPTVIEGGLYNAGTISATVRNTSDTPTTVSTTALLTSGYVNIGGYYVAPSATNPVTSVVNSTKYGYVIADSVSCSSGSSACTYTYADEDGSHTVDASTKGSLVNAGTIKAVASGTGASSTIAIDIATNSHVSSIVNTGTILASSTIDADRTDDVTALASYAIMDYSGTLSYIYNTGTIAAEVTTLDNDAQVNYAVYLTGNSLSNSGSGVTIVNTATSSTSAKIIGDIHFGDGDNEQLYVTGYSSTYMSYLVGDIYYGGSVSSGTTNGDLLYVGPYASVTGRVVATNGVDVQVYGLGTLTLQNDTTSLTASNLTVYDNATLTIGVSEDMEDTGAIDVLNKATIYSDAVLKVSYNSFVPQGDMSYLLIRASSSGCSNSSCLVNESGTALTTADLADYNSVITENMPFLFKSADLKVKSSTDGAYDEVVLNVTAKTSDELKLTGYAKKMFQYVNAALDIDPDLGAAMINDIGDGCGQITDGACTGSTTIAEAYAQAQKAYNSYAPNISGGTRAIALSLTDQATGIVGARQRAIRKFDRDESGMKFWTQGFAQHIQTDGQGEAGADGSYAKNGFKDKGFGFALGLDYGSPRFGWYGLATTFYNGNVQEIGRDSHENQLWMLVSAYTTWQGKHLFLDSKIDVGYARIRGKRYLTLTNTDGDTYTREADNTHAAETVSGGFTVGSIFDYHNFKFTPQFSLDGLLMRTEKYGETNPDSTSTDEQGFLLSVNPGYASSLRGFLGSAVEYDFSLLGVTWQPEARVGYRYDFLADQNKAKVAFKDINADITGSQPGTLFTLYGPDPAKNNLVAGASLGVNADTWSLNFGLDYVRGDHGLVEKIGMFNFVVRL